MGKRGELPENALNPNPLPIFKVLLFRCGAYSSDGLGPCDNSPENRHVTPL